MKNWKDDWRSSAILGELVAQLTRRERIRQLLGEVQEGDADTLIREALDELEGILERRWSRPTFAVPAAPSVPQSGAHGVSKPPQSSSPKPGAAVSSSRPPVVPQDKAPREPPPAPPKPVPPPAEVPVRIPFEAGSEPPRPAAPPSPPAPEPFRIPDAPQPPLMHVPQPPVETPVEFVRIREKVITALEQEDRLYIHGASLILPGDEGAGGVFEAPVSGFDQRSKVLAWDHRGIRLYVSVLSGETFSVSTTGMLLLTKQDSLRLRGMHERILNDLRVFGLVLPCEFGTVVTGLGGLSGRFSQKVELVRAGLDALRSTTTWTVSAYVLDTRVQQFLGTEGASLRRDRAEASASRTVAAGGRRTDVKTLERLLTREKKIADAILQELSESAEFTEVDQIVGMGSGASDDWKLILRAAFRVPPKRTAGFHHAVSDVQFRHLIYEPMLRLSGKEEQFSML